MSVVVPVYNTEKYLITCVDSILNQTYRNLEIILVDDGSTDLSSAICDSYAQKDSRVLVIHKQNGGASSARNVGIQRASGKWIMFVDSDDLLAVTIIEELLRAKRLGEARILICSLAYMNGDAVKNINQSRLTGKIEESTSHQLINNLWKSEYDNSLFTTPVCKMYDREFFGEKLQFREGIMCEDDELFNRLYLSFYPVVILHKALYYWRMNPDSTTHQRFSKKNCIMLTIQQERVDAFTHIGFVEQAQKTAKVFCELYIEYFYKAQSCGHPEWVIRYKHIYKMYKKRLMGVLPFKHIIRYYIFDFCPNAYKKMLLR